MAAGKSNRARRTRARAAPPKVRDESQPKLRTVLDSALARFSEALALLETTCQALEGAHDSSEFPDTHAIALRHAVGLLQRTYTAFDLAILKVKL
jgi:hypothetical protein